MNRIFTFLLLLGLPGPFIRAQCIQLLPGCGLTSDTVCDLSLNAPLLWNETYWLDPIHDLHDLAEGPTDLQLTAVDTCPGAVLHIRCVLLLDLDMDGVKETAIDSDNLPPAGVVMFGNAQNPGYTGGTARNYDERPVNTDLKYRFALDTMPGGGDTLTAALRWNNEQSPNTFVVPQLPIGTHQIRWFVTNGLGDTLTCERAFQVMDCKAPVVFCLPSFSVNIQQTGSISLWATDFLQYGEDNITPPTPYTPGLQLVYAIRKTGQGTGFPLDGFGQPVTQVTFDCDSLGVHSLELWARDAAGNAAFCNAAVTVQDPFNNCGTTLMTTICAKEYCFNEPVEGVTFTLSGNAPPGLPPFNTLIIQDSMGCFTLLPSWPLSVDYTITPLKDDDYNNGVSTFDLVLMSKHILGIELLDSPYKIIAADVNKSNSVTTFDIVELRKLVLGIYNDLPNNTSWRFISKDFVFSNPSNPFASVPFKEVFSLADDPVDFVAIKIGDLNCSAIANTLRPNGILLTDRQLEPGELVDIPFAVAESADWLGMQFALEYDPATMEVEHVKTKGTLPSQSSDNFGVFPGRVAVSWSDASAEKLQAGDTLFTLSIRILKPVRLSDLLRLEQDGLIPEAYTEDMERQPLRLIFRTDEAQTEAIQVFSAQPNPTRAGASIPLSLHTPAGLSMQVFDADGKKVYETENQLDAGFWMLDIPENAMSGCGVYYWLISLNSQSFSGRVIRL
ncbi:MAG: T9SS type A sorting domain-containing protein [Saprospiraceae bacterium]|nr:T9SS type A sorting domain-containing protein [Saprospiraceae bacterium]